MLRDANASALFQCAHARVKCSPSTRLRSSASRKTFVSPGQCWHRCADARERNRTPPNGRY